MTTMGAHKLDVIPFAVSPNLSPWSSEKPILLQGIWITGIGSELGRAIGARVRFDTAELNFLIVVDRPDYVRGMLGRLRCEGARKELLDELAQERDELKECYFEHPVEMGVDGDDVAKLVLLASILAGARSFAFHGSITVEKQINAESSETFEVQDRWEEVRRWKSPSSTRMGAVNFSEVTGYCSVLEPFFRPECWKGGRLAVALGSFWTSVTVEDPAQRYLALMTVFEAILSTDRAEITHQISERMAFLLERAEEERYQLYRRMKRLYDTRSQLVHGDVVNKPGPITTDRLRLDARITIVPKQDAYDAFELSVRLLRHVLSDQTLRALLQGRQAGKGAQQLLPAAKLWRFVWSQLRLTIRRITHPAAPARDRLRSRDTPADGKRPASRAGAVRRRHRSEPTAVPLRRRFGGSIFASRQRVDAQLARPERRIGP